MDDKKNNLKILSEYQIDFYLFVKLHYLHGIGCNLMCSCVYGHCVVPVALSSLGDGD